MGTFQIITNWMQTRRFTQAQENYWYIKWGYKGQIATIKRKQSWHFKQYPFRICSDEGLTNKKIIMIIIIIETLDISAPNFHDSLPDWHNTTISTETRDFIYSMQPRSWNWKILTPRITPTMDQSETWTIRTFSATP